MNPTPDGADLRDHLHRTLDDLAPPAGLHDGVLERGRSARRRQRVLTVGGGLAAAALAAAVVVPMAGGSGPTGAGVAGDPSPAPAAPTPTAPPSGPSTAAPTGVPSEAPEPSDDVTAPQSEGWWDAPSKDLLETLKDQLPSDVSVRDARITSEDVDGEPVDGVGFVGATLDGTGGAGSIELILYPPEPAAEDVPPPATTTDADGDEHTDPFVREPAYKSRLSCPGNLTAYEECKAIKDDEGNPLARISTSTPGDITIYEVTLLGPDGGLLYAASTNTLDDKWGRTSPSSASEPLVALKQLRAMVEDDAWTSYEP